MPVNWPKCSRPWLVRPFPSSGYQPRFPQGEALALTEPSSFLCARDLASWEGIYCEVASAAALAGIRRAMAAGLLEAEESSERQECSFLSIHYMDQDILIP